MNKKLKLIQVLEHYHLYDGDKAIATSIVGNPMLLPNLSIKNCETIKRGFDLDALAEKKYPFDKGYGVYERNCQISDLQDAFLEGFQMRDKMLGDKKFSEEDMIRFMQFIISTEELGNTSSVSISTAKYYVEKFSDKQQQTEWDCIVEMEEVYDGLDEMAQPQYSKQPKLDEKGKIILKRI